MASIFTKIINKEIPANIIAENNDFIAFLDAFPCAKGHTLIVPKKEVDYIFDLDSETYLGLMAFAKTISKAVEKAIPCKRIGVSVIGLEVPHTHVHLIPLNSMADMDFGSKLKIESTELTEIAEKIKSFL